MACSVPPAVEVPVESLLATVAALEQEADVVVGVVGSGADQLRAAVPRGTPVYRLTVADGEPLGQVATPVFPVAGRCVLVARQDGLWFGSDVVRAGPYASIGLFAVEGGLRVAVTPWSAGGERRQGIEARAAWFGDRAFLGAVAWTMVWR